MNGLSDAMKQYLIKALDDDGDLRVTNYKQRNALVSRGLIEYTSGYGYGRRYGEIQTLTPAGRELALKLKKEKRK